MKFITVIIITIAIILFLKFRIHIENTYKNNNYSEIGFTNILIEFFSGGPFLWIFLLFSFISIIILFNLSIIELSLP